MSFYNKFGRIKHGGLNPKGSVIKYRGIRSILVRYVSLIYCERLSLRSSLRLSEFLDATFPVSPQHHTTPHHFLYITSLRHGEYNVTSLRHGEAAYVRKVGGLLAGIPFRH